MSLANTAALILAFCWLGVIYATLNPEVDDFKQYWQASVNVRKLGDPYATTTGQELLHGQAATPQRKPGYPCPPFFAYLILPLSFLELRQAQSVWFGFNVFALAGLVWLCILLSGSQFARRYWGVVALGVVLAPPTFICLQLGQVGILLALLVVAGFAMASRNGVIAGLMLAFATLIKLYPALMIVYSIVQRLRKLAFWSVVMSAAVLLVSVVFHGIHPYSSYVEKVLLGHLYPYAAEFNISLTGFCHRLLVANDYAVALVNQAVVAKLVICALSVVVVSLCIWASRSLYGNVPPRLQTCIWLCAMLVLSPVNGYYNLVLLLLPMLVMLHYLEQHPNRNIRNGLVLATVLVWFPPGWTNWQPTLYNTFHRNWGVLLLTPSFYGLLLYFLLLLALLRRQSAKH